MLVNNILIPFRKESHASRQFAKVNFFFDALQTVLNLMKVSTVTGLKLVEGR